MPLRRAGVFLFLFFTSVASSSRAETPAFEPTDLEVEKPGTLDIDVQTGMTYGAGAWGRRFIVTDLEIDLGIYDNVELDLDATFTSDLQPDGVTRALTTEALWPSVKLGLFGVRIGGDNLALGAQIGPRIPIVTGFGAGYAALGLLGWTHGRLHVVLNGGFVMDPRLAVPDGRPVGGLVGVDTIVQLDSNGVLAVASELGGTAFASGRGEAHQTIGLVWQPYRNLAFTAVLLTGLSPSPDRGALLLGVSPKIDLF